MANDLASALVMEVRETSPCRKDFDFTVPAEAVARETDRAVRDFASNVNMPGFRRGKAPVNIIKSRYAEDINQELQRRVIYAAFDKVNADKSLDIVSCGMEKEPEFKAGEDFKFTLNADLAPEFEVGDYKNIKVEVPATEVEEDKVDERINFYRSMYANYVDAEGAAEAGDMLKVNYKADFALPEDASASLKRQVETENGYIWLSEPEIIPGCIAALTGAESGKEYKFDAVYPADYREAALAGQTLSYTVTVNAIQRKKDLTDEELCEKTRTPSLEEFRKMIRTSLESEAKAKSRGELVEKVYEALSGAIADFDLPPAVLATETNKEMRKLANELVKSEADVEEFKNKSDEHKKSAEEAAKKALKKTFILRKIAKLENISLNQGEVEAQLKGMSQYYGYKEKEFRSMLEKTGGMEDIQIDILNAKVLDFLANKAEEAAKA